jgi:hypothetical protein
MNTVGPSWVRSMGGSHMLLSLLMTILVTLGFPYWKSRMKCLSTFEAWL